MNDIVKFASEAVGESYYGTLKSGFDNRKTDLKTRISFKVLQTFWHTKITWIDAMFRHRSYQDFISIYFNIWMYFVIQYSASRGVYGTPTFFVNGFQLPDSGSSLDFNRWKSFIDPLIGAKGDKYEENLHFLL